MKVAIYVRQSGTRQYKPATPRGLYAPDTTFCLRYTERGKRKWQQLDVTTYKEARAAALKKLSELITEDCKETPTLSAKLRENFNLPAPRPLPTLSPPFPEPGSSCWTRQWTSTSGT